MFGHVNPHRAWESWKKCLEHFRMQSQTRLPGDRRLLGMRSACSIKKCSSFKRPGCTVEKLSNQHPTCYLVLSSSTCCSTIHSWGEMLLWLLPEDPEWVEPASSVSLVREHCKHRATGMQKIRSRPKILCTGTIYFKMCSGTKENKRKWVWIIIKNSLKIVK